jgi:hypothetical protein
MNPLTGTYTCTCLPTFTGYNCAFGLCWIFFYKYLCWLLKYVLFKAVCALNCKNGGTCQLNNGVSQCICSKFYLGTLCEICNCLKIWVDNN